MIKKVIVWVIVCAFLGLDLAPAAFAQSTPGPGGTSSATVIQLLEFSLKTVKKMRSGIDTDPFNQGTDVSGSPNFTFGNLSKVTDTTVGSSTFGQFLYMRGEFFYYVLMIAATSGRKYKITETGSALTGPNGATLPLGSVMLVPDYQWQDQAGIVGSTTTALLAPPGSAFVGPITSACLSNSMIYQSDSAGQGRLVRAVIGIGGPSSGSVPFNFSLGTNGSTGQGVQQNFDGTLAGQSGIKWTPVTPDQVAGTYNGTITFSLVLD